MSDLSEKFKPISIGNHESGLMFANSLRNHLPDYPVITNHRFPVGAMTCAAPNDKPLSFDTLLEIKKMVVPIQPALEIQISEYLPTKQVQAVRHKRKSSRRWQKKYLKRFGTKQVRTGEIVQIGNKLIMDSITHKRVMNKIQDGFEAARNEQMLSFWR